MKVWVLECLRLGTAYVLPNNDCYFKSYAYSFILDMHGAL